jgi:peptide/nickel transport system permease protein
MTVRTAVAQPSTGLGVDASVRPPRSPMRIALTRMRRAPLAVGGTVVLLVIVLALIAAPLLTDYGRNEIDLFNINADPSRAHLLGTDPLGRDVLTRLLYGGRLSLLIGVSAALLTTFLGIIAGAAAGYYGGWIDSALMRFVDLMLAFPSIFLLLIIAAMLDGITVSNIVLFLGFFGWMWLARIIRGEFLSLKQREFTEAARAIGVPSRWIIVRHLLPNVVGPIIVATTLGVAQYILAEAALSFLGFGVTPETPTWGNMLNEARAFYTTKPLLAIVPGVTLTITVLAINFVGDGLRDALDPHHSQ